MSFGFIEVITLLLGLSGFGLQANPKAPTPEVSLQYAMPDADVVMHVDVASVIPGNYKMLAKLSEHPQIKTSPELAKMVRKAVGEVEGARGLAKAATGIDLATDLHDATVFLRFEPQQEPTFVATVHGKFPMSVVDKIGKMSKGRITKIGGGAMVETGGNDPAIGLTRDGVMLAGTASLVRDRLAPTWKPPVRTTGSNLAYASEVLSQRPIFALVLTMSANARTQAITGIGGKNFLTDLVKRHKAASFSVFHNGIGWTWIDSSRAGLDAMAMMSEGALELLKAAQIAPRGLAKIALGAIDSYKGTDRRVDELIRRKADVMKIVETYSGDGTFTTKLDRDPRALKLTVRATGKSLSEVVPAGFLVPFALIGTLRATVEEPMPMQSPPPPRPVSPGLGGPRKK